MANISGFIKDTEDSELSTPEHDSLVLLLLNTDYVQKNFLTLMDDYEFSNKYIQIISEHPLRAYNGYNVGFLDVVVAYGREAIFIECKPEIKSFGTTLRQLRKYQSHISSRGWRNWDGSSGIPYDPDNRIFLFTPDTRFKEAFESQGIRVVTP